MVGVLSVIESILKKNCALSGHIRLYSNSENVFVQISNTTHQWIMVRVLKIILTPHTVFTLVIIVHCIVLSVDMRQNLCVGYSFEILCVTN